MHGDGQRLLCLDVNGADIFPTSGELLLQNLDDFEKIFDDLLPLHSDVADLDHGARTLMGQRKGGGMQRTFEFCLQIFSPQVKLQIEKILGHQFESSQSEKTNYKNKIA